MIDLHTHSSCSDGTLTPAELVSKARESNITHLALTDHDTAKGSREAAQASKKCGIVFIAGIEISAAYLDNEIHILGLGIDPDHPGLKELINILQQNRKNRNLEILEKAAALGYLNGTPEELLDAGSVSGRPHIARLLVENGKAFSIQDAFQRYLGKGRELYISRKLPDPRDVFALIAECGGVSSLAHPNTIIIDNGYSVDELCDCIVSWKNEGLDGIETFHPNLSLSLSRALRKTAVQHYMLTTGGSDFHGHDRAEKQMLGRWHKKKRIPVGIISRLTGRIDIS